MCGGLISGTFMDILMYFNHKHNHKKAKTLLKVWGVGEKLSILTKWKLLMHQELYKNLNHEAF